MSKYNILGVNIETHPHHVIKQKLQNFLNKDRGQHQIVTVNPEFVVAAQKDKEFKNILNKSSLATIDGAGIIKALQFMGHGVSLNERLTGVDLSKMLIDLAIEKNIKILFCLYGKGLTKPDKFFIKIKDKYPALFFQVADEKSALEKARLFAPHIILVGFGAPRQDVWIAKNLHQIPSAKIAVGVGGTFDYLSGKIKRAPKLLRSLGLEWTWRFIHQPWRIYRIKRAVLVFPWLVLKNRYKKNNIPKI